ncbi:YjcB family protein [Candidatus Sodalis pierantonius]|uniref:YjcB family protein n=1 Tax=Candidatus Sodalis pierantonii TaxID=1486991 RepID=UPI00046D8588|nr:YjcB family protein [Candidatus Sodalis pierantonius]
MTGTSNRSSRNATAFIFTGVGIGMACWFVTGLLGITLAQLLMIRHEMWESMKQGMLFMMANTPPDLQFT